MISKKIGVGTLKDVKALYKATFTTWHVSCGRRMMRKMKAPIVGRAIRYMV